MDSVPLRGKVMLVWYLTRARAESLESFLYFVSRRAGAAVVASLPTVVCLKGERIPGSRGLLYALMPRNTENLGDSHIYAQLEWSV